ncbi:hypothetical protein [Chiayiivirga flava]|uniref:Uncharacterized protein n=1 Tax=Chiayiivirga flava TaxID=659595 RepID=A0A7W8D4F7_9GAMM|nr:hypothetical protein [Chiayiivirga flava]MBB5206506.1 hypothetical protein [Chiayiivirga flava]
MPHVPPEPATWARSLLPLLQPIQATRVEWLRVPADTAPVSWHAVHVLPDGGAVGEGWLFMLGPLHEGAAAVFIETPRGAARDRGVLLASTVCRLAWQLHAPGGEMAADAPLDPALTDAIHALRNGLNTTGMNAAVLAACAAQLPHDLVPVVKQVEQASGRSGVELHRLVTLLETRCNAS